MPSPPAPSPDRSRAPGLASAVIGGVLLGLGTVLTGLLPLLARQESGLALVRTLSVLLQVAHGLGGAVGLALGVLAVVRGGRGVVLGGVGIGLALGALAVVVGGLLQLGLLAATG